MTRRRRPDQDRHASLKLAFAILSLIAFGILWAGLSGNGSAPVQEPAEGQQQASATGAVTPPPDRGGR